MVTAADMVTFQRQLRQEMADVTQQLCTELRIDMLNSINTAVQNLSAKPAASMRYRINDLIRRNWVGGNAKGEFRHFSSDLHLWMQAWSDEGETTLVSVAVTSSTTPRWQWIVQKRNSAQLTVTLPRIVQNNSKRTTEKSSASARTEKIRSAARNRECLARTQHTQH